jgi:hypothetical protein
MDIVLRRPLATWTLTLAVVSALPGATVRGDDLANATESPAAAAPSAESPSADSSAPAPLSEELLALRQSLRGVLAAYVDRPINTQEHTPWEVFHWVLAYNVDTRIRVAGPEGDWITAVGWLCASRPCRGQRLLTVERDRITALRGVGVQGHDGQFLAILAQSRVPATYPLSVGDRQFTVADLVESEKLGCRRDMELTFKLIGIVHYQPSDTRWKSGSGEDWDVPKLIHEEIAKPIHGAACGGTHRLMGLSYAVRMREKRDEPVDGEFARAQQYIRDYHRYTFGLQNDDGSFSTAWFKGRESRADEARRVQTTGHILEWLSFSLADGELRDERTVRAVAYLVGVLDRGRERTWDIGPLGHALRGLSVYDRRVFQPYDDSGPLAAGPVEVLQDDLDPGTALELAAPLLGPPLKR